MTSYELRAWATREAANICANIPVKWFSSEDTLEYLDDLILALQSKFGELEYTLHPEYYEIPEQTGELRADSATERAPIAGHPPL